MPGAEPHYPADNRGSERSRATPLPWSSSILGFAHKACGPLTLRPELQDRAAAAMLWLQKAAQIIRVPGTAARGATHLPGTTGPSCAL